MASLHTLRRRLKEETLEKDLAEEPDTADKSTAKKNDKPVVGLIHALDNLNKNASAAKNLSVPLQNTAALPNNKMDSAAMYLNDATTLHQKSAISSSWYEPYGTTLLLIVLLHLVFLRQWNARKTRKQVMVSYRILVQKKHWYRCILAILSHPPVDPLSSSSSSGNTSPSRSSIAVSFGNEQDNNNIDNSRRRYCDLLKRACTVVTARMQPVLHGHLSGLPLLTYNCHILWSCRALEPTYTTHWHYARVLLGLTFVALALELRLSHNVLGMNRAFVGFGSRLDDGSARIIQTRRAVLNRSIVTPTMLTSALFMVYRGEFPFVDMKILPFLPTTRVDPAFSFFCCIALLVTLSWKSHPVTSVVCGTMSGLLWTAGITSFLANAYWGSCLILVLVVMCALSMRPQRLGRYVPCVDYVAWDHHGVIRREQGDDRQLNTDQEQDDEEEDQVMDEGDIENRPLLRRNSSRGGSANIEDEIHGRLPLMNMDSSEIDDMQVPAGASIMGTPGLSRRGGGGGSSSHPMDGAPNTSQAGR